MMVRMLTSLCAVLLVSPVTFLFSHGNQPGHAELTVENGSITVDYVAPELKGRDLDALLQQPGANPWRMGADRPTTLETTVPLRCGETTVEPGSYRLQAYRDEGDQWWLQVLNESQAVVGKAPLQKSTAASSEEHMVISLSGSGGSAGFKLQWGTYVLSGELQLTE